MKNAAFIARLALGLIFLIFGLNGFFNFLPMPPVPDQAGAFLGGLAGSGYMFPLIKGTEVIVAIALLSGFFVPLALIVLAPITVNIVLFHGILAPAGLVLPLVILILHLYLAYANIQAYAPVLKAK